MTKLTRRAAELFGVRSGEGPLVALMFLHSFFVGMTIVFLETPASSLFLTYFDVGTLPYIFMATAAASVLIGFLITSLQNRFAPTRFFLGLLVFLAAGTAGIYLALSSGVSRSLVLALMVWKDVVWTLVIIEFWAVAGLLLHVRQGKRLFGLLNSGKILAGLAAGLATPFVVPHLGALNLLALALVGLLGAIGSLLAIVLSPALWPARSTSGGGDVPASVDGAAPGWRSFFRDRFLLYFFSVTVLSSLAFYFVEYAFYDQIERTYPGEDEIASFFGLYIGVGQGLNLILSALVTGRLLTRFGLSVGLLSVPGLATVGIAAAVASRFFPAGGSVFFWCVVGTKLVQEVVGNAVEVPASRILYQPLGSRERLRVQAVRESIVEPAAAGIAGLLLLLLPVLFAIRAFGILWIVLGLFLTWIAVALALRSEYTRALARALKRRQFQDIDLSLEDASSLQVLERELQNPRPGAIIYCLNTLADLKHPALDRFLIRLLDHPSDVVRTFVLGQIEQRQISSAAEEVARRIEAEPEAAVRGAALRAFCAVTDERGIDRALRFLEAPEPEMWRGAVIGLLRSGGIEGVLAAGTRLNQLIGSSDFRDRLFAADALGEVGISSFYRPLVQLLEDPEMRVRREALKAAAKLRSPGLTRPLIANLNVPAVADAAVSCLIAYGSEVLAELEEIFRRDDTPISVRSRIVRIAGHVGSAEARTFLKAWIDHPQEDLRYSVLRALVKCGYRATGEEAGRLRQSIFFEAEDAAWTLATLIDLGEEKQRSEIGAALEREFRKNTQRILILLSFMYPAEAVLRAEAHLGSESASDRARALEVLDNLLDADLKSVVVPLVDDLSVRARLGELDKRFHQERLGREGRLRQLITRTSDQSTAWAKACAIHAVGSARLAELEDALASALEDPDPFIRETAVWALAQLRPENLAEHLTPLVADPAEPVARLARWLLEAQSPVTVLGGVAYLARTAGYRTDFLERLLTDPGQSLGARSRAARILGALADPQAEQILLKRLSIRESPVRTAILEALTLRAMGRDSAAGKRRRQRLSESFDREISAAVKVSSWIVDFPEGDLFRQLRAALEAELEGAKERILRILVLLSEGGDFETFRFWYLRSSAEEPPGAVAESLRSMIASSAADEGLREKVRRFLDKRDPKFPSPEPRPRPPLADALREIAADASVRAWTRACSLQMLARLGLPECVAAVVGTLDDPEELVREIAYWALYKLSPSAFHLESRRRGEDRSPRVARFVRALVRASEPVLERYS